MVHEYVSISNIVDSQTDSNNKNFKMNRKLNALEKTIGAGGPVNVGTRICKASGPADITSIAREPEIQD